MSNIDWHAGFVSAMKLELMADEKNLEFREEQFLDERKQRFDLLIVKKRRNVRIRNEIGEKKITMCQAVNELFADEIAELKIQLNEREQALIKQRTEMEAEKNALLDEKTAQIAALQAELLKYKASAATPL